MDENRDFLPAKLNDLKNQLPMISDELAKRLTMLPEELRHIPSEYDHEAFVKHGEKLIENHLLHGEQTELELGALLICIKEISGDEKLYETVCRWGMTLQTARIFMKNTRDFGDTPEMVEGMGYRKMERLGSLPEECLSQLKINGRIILPDGTEKTMTEFKAMTYREMSNEIVNIKQQYRKDKNKLQWEVESLREEVETARKQDEDREKILKEQLRGETKTLYEKMKLQDKILAEKDAKINKLEIELSENNQQEVLANTCFHFIDASKRAGLDLFFIVQDLKLTHNDELLKALIKYVEDMNDFNIKFDNRLQNLVNEEVEREKNYRGENDEQEDT